MRHCGRAEAVFLGLAPFESKFVKILCSMVIKKVMDFPEPLGAQRRTSFPAAASGTAWFCKTVGLSTFACIIFFVRVSCVTSVAKGLCRVCVSEGEKSGEGQQPQD